MYSKHYLGINSTITVGVRRKQTVGGSSCWAGGASIYIMMLVFSTILWYFIIKSSITSTGFGRILRADFISMTFRGYCFFTSQWRFSYERIFL